MLNNSTAASENEQSAAVLQLSYDVNNPVSAAQLNSMSKLDLISMVQTLYKDITNCCEVIRQTDEKCHLNYEQYRKHLNMVQYSYTRLQKELSKEKNKLSKKAKTNNLLSTVPENKSFDDKELLYEQSVQTAAAMETVNKQQCKTEGDAKIIMNNNWIAKISKNINNIQEYQPLQQSTVDAKVMMINKYVAELAEMKQFFNDSQSQLALLTYKNMQLDYNLKNNESVNESLNDRLCQILKNENLLQKTVNDLNAALGESEARCAQLQDTNEQAFKKMKDVELEIVVKGKKKVKQLPRLVSDGETIDVEREMLNKSQHLEECIGRNMQLQAQMQASDIEKKSLEKDIEQYRRSLSDSQQNNVQLQTNLQQLMMQIMYNWSQYCSHSQPAQSRTTDQCYNFQFSSQSNI